MKSVSLTFAEVTQILQAHLNAHELKTPHTVVDIDPWSYGPQDEMQFNITLRPGLAPEPPVTAVTPVPPAVLTVGANGNGAHDHPPVTAVTPHKEVAIREQNGRKRGESKYDAEQRAAVVRLRYVEGQTILAIVERTHIPESSIYAILADHRKHNPLVSDATRSEVYRLYEAGVAPEAIVAQLGLSETVYCAIIEPAIRNQVVRRTDRPAQS